MTNMKGNIASCSLGSSNFAPTASGWQSDVLKQDPRVLCADNHRTLTGFLETPEPLEVLALRQSSLTVERLKALCPSGMRDKTLFLEV